MLLRYNRVLKHPRSSHQGFFVELSSFYLYGLYCCRWVFSARRGMILPRRTATAESRLGSLPLNLAVTTRNRPSNRSRASPDRPTGRWLTSSRGNSKPEAAMPVGRPSEEAGTRLTMTLATTTTTAAARTASASKRGGPVTKRSPFRRRRPRVVGSLRREAP